MKKAFIISFFISYALGACKGSQEKKQVDNDKIEPSAQVNKDAAVVRRFGMVTGIRQDKIEYYKKLHASAWPAVLNKIKECNIQNYSIYLQKINDKYFLFSYFEYTGDNFEMDMKKMAADSTTQKWWKETDPTQMPLPQATAKKQIWTEMEEVFHTN
jgi:L-rhamnose mutarotase